MDLRPRLNLFALPSQTSLVFLGIMIVIGLPLLMSFSGRFALLLPLLPIVVVLFTLWDFLAEPVRIARRTQAEPVTGPDGEWLTTRVGEIAQQAGLRPAPILLQSHNTDLLMPVAFGTWRQRYLLLPAGMIARLREVDDNRTQKRSYADVVLCHELAHFVNHDVALANFARSLLKQTILVVSAYWFAQMWTPIIYAVWAPRMPEIVANTPADIVALLPAQLLELVRNPPTQTPAMMIVLWLELTMAILPLALGALFLWRRDWYLLLRVREYYADARVVAWLGPDGPSVSGAHSWVGQNRALDVMAAAGDQRQRRHRWRPHYLRTPQSLPLSWPSADIGKWLLPTPQPTGSSRRKVLEHPELAYGSVRQVGLQAGVIVLLPYLMLASLLSPAPKGIGAEIVIAVGFLVLAAALTPSALVSLPDKRVVRRDRLRALGYFLLVFDGFMAVALAVTAFGVLAYPDFVQLPMYAIAGVLPATIQPVIDDPVSYGLQVVAGATLIFCVAAPLLLYAFLALDFAVKRRVLHWYGAAWLSARSSYVMLGISSVLAAVIWFGAAPLLSLAAFPGILEFEWSVAAGAVVALLLAVSLWLWIRRGDRRYRNRCPRCGCEVVANFHLGLTCSHCGEPLQSWLVTPR